MLGQDDVSYSHPQGAKPYRKLKLNWLEQILLVAMVLVILVTGFDAINGAQIGKNQALEQASRQGEQGLMAGIGQFFNQ